MTSPGATRVTQDRDGTGALDAGLEEVSRALREGRTVEALDRVLELWRLLPAVALASLVDALGLQIDRSLAPLIGTTLPTRSPELHARWLEQASLRRPADVPRLLAALPHGSLAELRQRFELLERFPADPRLPAPLLELACSLRATAAHPLRTRAFRLARATGDGRVLPLCQRLLWDWPQFARPVAGIMPPPSLAEETREALRVVDVDLRRLLAVPPPSERSLFATSRPVRDESALLAAILADPTDDATREVYGDTLAERGDPRGELIQLQMARLRQKPTRAALQRERALLREHAASWIRPLDLVIEPRSIRFERGFLDEGKAVFVTEAQRELIDAPLWSTLRTLECNEDALFLRLAPTLRVARGISVSGLARLAALRDEVVLEQASGPRARVYSLDLELGLPVEDREAWRGIGEIGALDKLVELRLAHRGPAGELAFLLDAPLGQQLRRLQVGFGPLASWLPMMANHPRLEAVGLRYTADSTTGGVNELVSELVLRRDLDAPAGLALELHMNWPFGRFDRLPSVRRQLPAALEGFPRPELPRLQLVYTGARAGVDLARFRRVADIVADRFEDIELPLC